MKNNRTRTQAVVVAAIATLASLPARAEPPMHVDDAGTLAKGGMKIEGAWSKDDKTRGLEGVFGFAPIDHLEIGLSLAHEKDRSEDPATKIRGTGVSFKWVPLQNETGWSVGASLAYGHHRVKQAAAEDEEDSSPSKYTAKEYAFSGLATYRFKSEQVVHLNLGATRSKALGERDTVNTWGIGFEQPLVDRLKLTAEIFGEEHSRPDKAIGLRYEIREGLKVSAAIGRGNDRDFGQVGFPGNFDHDHAG